jgi:hypothetical protein
VLTELEDVPQSSPTSITPVDVEGAAPGIEPIVPEVALSEAAYEVASALATYIGDVPTVANCTVPCAKPLAVTAAQIVVSINFFILV